MRREYSSLGTMFAQQCSTCCGRDGTIASRSIDTDRRFAALVLTRKQKAIAGPSVSFQQGSPGFQVRILLTSLSQLLSHCSSSRLHRFLTLPDLFAQINNVLLPNMLSKLVKEDENFPPRKKEKSGPGYAAKQKIQLKIS